MDFEVLDLKFLPSCSLDRVPKLYLLKFQCVNAQLSNKTKRRGRGNGNPVIFQEMKERY